MFRMGCFDESVAIGFTVVKGGMVGGCVNSVERNVGGIERVLC